MTSLSSLEKKIMEFPLAAYPKSSRVHRLNSFDFKGCKAYVKREDELGCGISGSKFRKYLSLVPHLLAQSPDQAIVTGTSFSNHVLSITQLLIENQITPVLFLLGRPPHKRLGNFLFTSMLLNFENIHWFSKNDWKNLDQATEDYVKEKSKENIKVSIIPKGGSCKEALPGAATLALDLARNEKELGFEFDHIIIDSGTGMMASSLILAFTYLQRRAHFHIIQIAGVQTGFYTELERRKNEFQELLKIQIPSPSLYTLYLPENARSFGSVNAKVLGTIREIARNEGFLTDPIYTSKLFIEGKRIIQASQLKGNILFIHSGGILSLSGFQEQLSKKE